MRGPGRVVVALREGRGEQEEEPETVYVDDRARHFVEREGRRRRHGRSSAEH